jgi:hypothetical protein
MNIFLANVVIFTSTLFLGDQIVDSSQEEAFTIAGAQEIIAGVVIAPGMVCPRLQLDDGRRISLMGVDRSLALGERLSLEGQWATRSTCQQGPTFHATRFEVVIK